MSGRVDGHASVIATRALVRHLLTPTSEGEIRPSLVSVLFYTTREKPQPRPYMYTSCTPHHVDGGDFRVFQEIAHLSAYAQDSLPFGTIKADPLTVENPKPTRVQNYSKL